MASYKVVLQNQADKTYRWLFRHGRSLHARIRSALQFLQANPNAGKLLAGSWKGAWLLRVGVYRIVYRIEKKELLILVLDIGHRREVYR